MLYYALKSVPLFAHLAGAAGVHHTDVHVLVHPHGGLRTNSLQLTVDSLQFTVDKSVECVHCVFILFYLLESEVDVIFFWSKIKLFCSPLQQANINEAKTRK